MTAADGYEDLIGLAALYERLLRKAPEFEATARKAKDDPSPLPCARFGGMAEGVRLALTFITEVMQERGLTYVAQARQWVDWSQMGDKGILDG